MLHLIENKKNILTLINYFNLNWGRGYKFPIENFKESWLRDPVFTTPGEIYSYKKLRIFTIN